MEAQDIQSAHEMQSVLEATHLNGQTSEEALQSGLLNESALPEGLAPSASSIALQAMDGPSAGSTAQQVPGPQQQPGSPMQQAGISSTLEARGTAQEPSSILLQADGIMRQANGPADSTPQQASRPAQHADSSARTAPSADFQAGRPTPQADSAVRASNGSMPGAARPACPAGGGALQAHGPMQQKCFTEELVGTRACFQLVDLGRQIYIWAGADSGAMGCMCLASPPQATATGSQAGSGRSLVCMCILVGSTLPCGQAARCLPRSVWCLYSSPTCKAVPAPRSEVTVTDRSMQRGSESLPPAGAGGLPPVATLLRGSADSAAASAAQRLARKTGRSVALAWALPEQPPMLAVLAERSIVERLAEMGLVPWGE